MVTQPTASQKSTNTMDHDERGIFILPRLAHMEHCLNSYSVTPMSVMPGPMAPCGGIFESLIPSEEAIQGPSLSYRMCI